MSCEQTIIGEARSTGKEWRELKLMAQNRVCWRNNDDDCHYYACFLFIDLETFKVNSFRPNATQQIALLGVVRPGPKKMF